MEKKWVIIIGVVALILGLAGGFLIGRKKPKTTKKTDSGTSTSTTVVKEEKTEEKTEPVGNPNEAVVKKA